MADYGMWQGAERATANLANTGMGLLRYKADREDSAARLLMQKEQLDLQKQAADRESQAFDYKMKQQEEVDARKNKLIDITVTPQFLSAQPEEQKMWLDFMAKNGYTDESGKGKTIDVLTGIETIGKSKELYSSFVGMRIENQKKAVVGAYQELQEAMAKNPEDKKIAQLSAKYRTESQKYLSMSEGFAAHLSKLELQSEKPPTPTKSVPKGFTEDGYQVNDEGGNLVYASGPQKGQPYTGGQLKGITESGMQAAMTGVVTWSQMAPEDKEFWYQKFAADKTAKPEFYYRDPKSKSEFMSGFAQYERSLGKTGADVISGRASVDSMKKSLAKQQINHGAMLSFVENINGQLGKIGTIMDDMVSRVGVRALDIPKRELIKRFKGSGQEAVLGAYLMEVSNEINKLSQGSQASIAVLPVESQRKWDAVHDPNLSFNELKIVLEGTREMANIRLGSVEKALADTEAAINAKAGGSVSKPTGSKYKIISVE